MVLARIDSVATTNTLCSNLRELPTYCYNIKGDTELLYSYFGTNYTQIIAHQAMVDNPINILFAAYMVGPCHNFRSYIKRKQEAYTDGTLTLTHEDLILLATNKFNLLKQEGTWGAKSPGKDKIMVMQAELIALKGQFQLAPNLKRAAEVKEDDKGGDKKQGGGNNKKKKNKKNHATKKEQKKDENWRRPSQGGRSTREEGQAPGLGASTTWRGVATRKETPDLAKSASTNKTVGSTKLRPRPPRQPSSTQNGKPSWPTWPPTWPMTDWPDTHGNHGQHSG
jgi:hypothetical protein